MGVYAHADFLMNRNFGRFETRKRWRWIAGSKPPAVFYFPCMEARALSNHENTFSNTSR
jgi:hypothetical protein